MAQQQTLPLAIVRGEPIIELPNDLFIPPEAMEVFLEAFEGPLDLLLYLIKKQKFDVVELPIYQITEQYLSYIDALVTLKVELAADYLVMAATLAEIKSRLLLPKVAMDDEDEGDPRARLIAQLQAYEVIKQAAQEIDALPRLERDFYQAKATVVGQQKQVILPDVSLSDLTLAFADILKRSEQFKHHHIERESLSTRERMTQILERLTVHQFAPFHSFFVVEEGRAGVVVTFLAMLELSKEHLIEIVQAELFGQIHLRLRGD